MKKVLLIHGMFMNSCLMYLFLKRLKSAGYEVSVYSYPLIPKEEDLTTLFIDKVKDVAPNYIVGHSFGGVLALNHIHHFPWVEKVVCLGSPLRGSVLGDTVMQSRVIQVMPAAMKKIAKNGIRIPRRKSLMVGSIAGNDDRISILKFAAFFSLKGFEEKNSDLKQKLDDYENDGVVFVNETRASSALRHVTIFANHTELVFSGEAHRQTIHFLENGFFDKKF